MKRSRAVLAAPIERIRTGVEDLGHELCLYYCRTYDTGESDSGDIQGYLHLGTTERP
jgi:hypothetical protein